MNYVFLLSMVATIFVSILGISEYVLYESEELEKSRMLSKLFLLGMLLVGLFGLLGLGLSAFSIPLSATWSGFSVLIVLIGVLALVQYRMHQKMGIDKSPLRRKLSRSTNQESSKDEGSVYEKQSGENSDSDEEQDGTEEFMDDSDRDVLGYKNK